MYVKGAVINLLRPFLSLNGLLAPPRLTFSQDFLRSFVDIAFRAPLPFPCFRTCADPFYGAASVIEFFFPLLSLVTTEARPVYSLSCKTSSCSLSLLGKLLFDASVSRRDTSFFFCWRGTISSPRPGSEPFFLQVSSLPVFFLAGETFFFKAANLLAGKAFFFPPPPCLSPLDHLFLDDQAFFFFFGDRAQLLCGAPAAFFARERQHRAFFFLASAPNRLGRTVECSPPPFFPSTPPFF